MEEFGVILGIILAVVIGLAVYFLPTIVGFKKGQPNKVAILLLNLFLGWSFIGWIVALVWAVKKEQTVQVINNINTNSEQK